VVAVGGERRFRRQAGRRVLQSHCRNADIDLLFVRAEDVPSTSQDGVVDCGITGLDLISERECDVEVLLRLGYGACSLQAASRWKMTPRASETSPVEESPRHPRIARRALADLGIDAELVQVTGSVEISPRLGSPTRLSTSCRPGARFAPTDCARSAPSSNRRRCWWERSVRWITRLVARFTMVLGSVINARANRYLLCNVAKSRLGEVTALLPTTGSPTVMDLATPGIVAVHALVPAAEIWSLLPRLEAAGASSILTLPVERWCRE